MIIVIRRSYRSKNGNTVFVYAVHAKPQDIEAFKTASGDFYRQDETGVPLWFTTRFLGNKGRLIITKNGKIVPDMSSFERAASLAKQFGGNFGQELARASAQLLLSGKTDTEETPEE